MENQNVEAKKQMKDDCFKPMTAFHYFRRSLLYTIPIIGWIAVLVTALSDDNNVNMREHARHYLWVEVIALVIVGITLAPSWLHLLGTALRMLF